MVMLCYINEVMVTILLLNNFINNIFDISYSSEFPVERRGLTGINEIQRIHERLLQQSFSELMNGAVRVKYVRVRSGPLGPSRPDQ